MGPSSTALLQVHLSLFFFLNLYTDSFILGHVVDLSSVPPAVPSPSKLCRRPIAMQASTGPFPQLKSDPNEAPVTTPVASTSKSKVCRCPKRAPVISPPVVESKSSSSEEAASEEAAVITSPPSPSPVPVSHPKRVSTHPLPVHSSPKAPPCKKAYVASPAPEKSSKIASGEFYPFPYFSLLISSYFIVRDISLYGLSSGHPYLDLVPSLFTPPTREDLVSSFLSPFTFPSNLFLFM